MKKLGGSLSTTVNHYNNASKEFVKIDKDVVKIANTEASVEQLLIDRPANDWSQSFLLFLRKISKKPPSLKTKRDKTLKPFTFLSVKVNNRQVLFGAKSTKNSSFVTSKRTKKRFTYRLSAC